MTQGARQLLQQIGFRRLASYVVLTLIGLTLARYTSVLPLVAPGERALYDLTTSLTSQPVRSDPRVTIITFTEDTLAFTGKRSPLDRGVLATALAKIDAMHPKAIGIDILIDQAQKDDDVRLFDTLKAMKTPTNIAYVTNEAGIEGAQAFTLEPWQQAFIDGLFAQMKGTNVHPALVLADTDTGVIRNWATPPKQPPPRFAQAMAPGFKAFDAYHGPIRFRRPMVKDVEIFNQIPIELFTQSQDVEAFRSAIEGRYILIGTNIGGTDKYYTPLSLLFRTRTNGVEVLAHELTQMLDGVKYTPLPGFILWLVVIAAAVCGGMTALVSIRFALPLAIGTLLLFVMLVPLFLQINRVDTQSYPMLGAMIAWFIGIGVVGGAARSVTSTQRSYAQTALGKYLPVDIASEILKNPDQLNLQGERREIFVIFTDLEGFTQLSDKIEPEVLAHFLNLYLEMLCKIVLEHGGTIDKFVGDAIVAFWGAPISRPDDADRAAQAAQALYLGGEAFRNSNQANMPPFGRTRVGLHKGLGVVGNFGGQSRIQYTALGDAMNTASRLESANKALESAVLASREALETAHQETYRSMGRIIVRGRASALDVFEAAPDFTQSSRLALNDACARYLAGEAKALADVEAIAATYPEDKALKNLVERFRATGPAAAYLLH